MKFLKGLLVVSLIAFFLSVITCSDPENPRLGDVHSESIKIVIHNSQVV